MGTAPPGVASLHRRLRPHPASVGEARRLVRAALRSAGRDELAEDAELLVSEVVTNALIHAGTHVDIMAKVRGTGLRVEVLDGSCHLPTRRDYAMLAGTGRGLKLLEHLVDRWGVRTHDGGKTVWFELSGKVAEAAEPVTQSDPGSASAPIGVTGTGPAPTPEDAPANVELLNMPLLLHAAWQMHAEAILREYLLVRLDEQDPDAVIEAHAGVNDAMTHLREQVPEPQLGDDLDALMAGATEPLVSAERVTICVPRESVPHFQLLDETLHAALEMADVGAFLTTPIQPELRLLRRWLCQEVLRQSEGEPPVPWSLPGERLRPPGSPVVAVAPVPTADQSSFIAADDTNRILAVSPSATKLLGYEEPGELVGHRLVDIIPPRYHQAHLAGFTLHLANGRSPLLGRPVTVPARRRDGTEVVVRLLVEAHQTSDGHRAFTATLTRAESAGDHDAGD